jgi:hypothetical protein
MRNTENIAFVVGLFFASTAVDVRRFSTAKAAWRRITANPLAGQVKDWPG